MNTPAPQDSDGHSRRRRVTLLASSTCENEWEKKEKNQSNQSINQSTNQSINQSINQPINQSINQSQQGGPSQDRKIGDYQVKEKKKTNAKKRK
jgi:hypothetical protein